MQKVTLYSDGSYRKNYQRGGYAGLFLSEDGRQYQAIYGNEEEAMNGRCELQAVVASLRYLTVPCEVSVISDSQYVVNGINLWVKQWAANGWKKMDRKPVANLDLWMELLQQMQVHQVHATWVKGHQNGVCPGNELVDYLASSASAMPAEFERLWD
jgi:ribonuclease HI